MQERFISTPHGRIHFHHGGSGSPLLLLHSNGGSAYDFEAVTERLSSRFEVFAWDMPGQGDSDPITRHVSVADYTDAAIAFMDALGLRRASVLGVSIGGAICVRMGAHHADRLDKLFIVECPYRSEAEWQKQWPRIEANFALPIQTRDAVAPRLREVSEEFLLRWNIDRSKAGAKTMVDVMWALREYDAASDLARVPEGSVVVFGDRGPTIGNMEAFIGPMRAPRVEVMRGSGHFPMVDAPDEFCALIERQTGHAS
ncbi:alpha/beta fold hydrolase [Roseomonas elaeocarpi]|uniref:Alpha/beta fold hydrolase n=1 Tax=Roseomonas elaeocarpi TaxID=907779 RepID=A0ABV6JPV6_9PROT